MVVHTYIPALERWRQEEQEFKVNLCYIKSAKADRLGGGWLAQEGAVRNKRTECNPQADPTNKWGEGTKDTWFIAQVKEKNEPAFALDGHSCTYSPPAISSHISLLKHS